MTLIATNILAIKRFATLEKDLISLHNNKYIYTNAIYKNTTTHIEVLCKIHGAFSITPANHLRGKGCAKCAHEETSKRCRSTQAAFVRKANLIHKGKYTYLNVVYKTVVTKISITCPIHGDFLQIPNAHLSGVGCPKCKGGVQKSLKFFINRANKLHNYAYDYSKAVYTNSKSKIIVICKKHGEFSQELSNHSLGAGCPSCSNRPNSIKPCLLYYLKIIKDNIIVYKIGVTTKSVKQRYTVNDLNHITILYKKWFKNGIDAYNEEQRILKDCEKWKYIGPPILASGNTELFSEDIMYK